MRALLIVVFAASTACASATARPQPFPRPGETGSSSDSTRPPRSVESAPASGYEISGTALSLRGTPYRNGGADPRGFDCSGFVWYVFAQHGFGMPRTVEEQYSVGGSIQPSEIQAGDLVFFNTTGRGATHVGIAIGGDSFVHAPSSRGAVRVERMSSGYWGTRFIGARRISP